MMAICNGNDSEGRSTEENRISASRKMEYVAHIRNGVREAVSSGTLRFLTIYK